MIKELDNNNCIETIYTSKKPVLIDFWAPWCRPCLKLTPIVKELAEEREDVLFTSANVDQATRAAIEFSIASVPTIVILDGGYVTAVLTGNITRERIEDCLPTR